ncbi:MAG TPA: DUF4383 domain-containing protein [Pilimelia sp.]|nr:DUF4383 domain-containing protein [Pilimelia sp.]
MHTPVNHPLRPLYRVIGGLAGLYVLLFGIVGLVETRGTELFGHPSAHAMGLRTNLAFSLLSIVAGVVILGAAVIGRNIDQKVNMIGGWAFMVIGMAMLALLQTDANFLNFSVATCVVSFVIGLALLTAGLYGKVGTAEDAEAEEAFRHRERRTT